MVGEALVNHECVLISRIVTDKCLSAVVELGVRADLFSDCRKEWNFLVEFDRTYAAPVPREHFEEAFPGFKFEAGNDATTDFLLGQMRRRRAQGVLIGGAKRFNDLLNRREPFEALDLMRSLALQCEIEAVVSNDVNVSADPLSRLADYDKLVGMGGVTGYPTPWPVLDEATQGFHDEELIMIAARGGVGKCLIVDTKIMDPVTGVLSTIEELYESRTKTTVLTWSKWSGVYAVPITQKHDTGRKTCLKFLLGTGRSVSVTPEHPFLTPEGWKRADKVRVGETIALPKRLPPPSKPRSLPDAELDILAIMLADGCCTSGGAVFSKQDPTIIKIAREAGEVLGIGLKDVGGGKSWRFSNGNQGWHVSNPVTEILHRHGLHGVLSKNKTMPEAVFRLPEDQLIRFLQVFWMCDGYVDASPCVVLASESLVRDFQHLLLRIGVQSSVGYKPSKCQTGTFDAWRLRVHSACLPNFACLELWGDRGSRFRELLVVKRNPNIGYPRISVALKDKLIAISKSGVSRCCGIQTEIAQKLGWCSFVTRELFGACNQLRVTPFKAFCDVHGLTSEYSWLWDSDLFWDTVDEIEDVGEQKIYDLTVHPTSCFIADDVVVHNTWAEVILARFLWWRHKVRCLVITKEMAVHQIIRRFDATQAGLPYQRFRSGQLTSEEYERWTASLKEMEGGVPFWVSGDEDGSGGVMSVAAKIEKYKPQIVFLDGLALMSDDRSAHTSWEKLGNLSQDLKTLARKKKLPIVVSHWFNKDGKGDDGDADDLKSGDIQNHYDLILGMYQSKELRNEHEMLWKILKQKEGAQISFVSKWDLEAMMFEVQDMGGAEQGEAASGRVPF